MKNIASLIKTAMQASSITAVTNALAGITSQGRNISMHRVAVLLSICCVALSSAEDYTPLTLKFSATALNFGFRQVGVATSHQTVTHQPAALEEPVATPPARAPARWDRFAATG